jgi:hypothetical protein
MVFEKTKERFSSVSLEKIGINLMSLTFIIWLVVFFIQDKLPSWINEKVFFVLSIVSGVFFFVQKIRKIPELIREKSSIVYYFSHFFLLSLVVIAVNQFLKNKWLIDNLFYISVLSIGFGFLTFYASRDRVEREIKDEKINEERAEKKRAAEFDEKFPRVAKIWGLRSFVRWMHKEGWWYSVGLILIVVLGYLLRIWSLNALSIWTDEATSFLIANRIYGGFGQTLLSGQFYPRAIIYHHYLAFLMKIFVNSAYVSRLANSPFYIINMILIYIFGRVCFLKKIALLSSFLFAFSWIGISMFWDLRFYEMFLSFFLILSLLILLFIKYISKIETVFELRSSLPKIIAYLSFILLVFLVAFDTHVSTVLILHCLFLFGLFLILIKKDALGLLLSILSLTVIIIGGIISYGRSFDILNVVLPPGPEWQSAISSVVRTLGFWTYLFSTGYFYLSLLLPLVIIFILISRKKEVLYIGAFFITLAILITLQGYGDFTIRYYYMILPFLFLLIAYSAYYAYLHSKKNRFLTYFVYFCLFLFIFTTIFSGVQESLSPKAHCSNNEVRNIDFNEAFSFIQNQSLENITIITDSGISMIYYAYIQKAPDYIFREAIIFDQPVDDYLNSSYIHFKDITKLKQDSIIILFNKKFYYIDDDTPLRGPLNFFDENGEEIYKTEKISIYFVNAE